MFTRMWALAGMMLVAMSALLPRAYAAEAERLLKQDIDRREQERRDRRWEESHTPAAPLPLSDTPASPMPPSAHTASAPCFPLRQIRLRPGNILPAHRVDAILRAWQGKCVDTQGLAVLQDALNAEALAQGLVTTRVVVPEQNLANGELDMEVWPGRVENLRALALGHMELALASPLHAGDLLQLRALEQTVDNLNRLASLQASLELLPGLEPGGSLVDFTVVRAAPWQAGVAWQSEALNGNDASNNLRANLTLDSPLRLADRFILGLNANLKDMQVDDAHGGSVDYDLPLGWWRFSIGADRFDYENVLKAGVTPFKATGASRSWRVELARLLHRDARNRLTLALHHQQRISDNYIDGVTVGVSSYRVQATGLRTDYSRVSAPWIWDATLDMEAGRTLSPARVSPYDADYTRVLASTRLQYQLQRTSLSASFSGQWSRSQLATSEQFTLTGQVPGFSPVSANADNGVSGRLEAAWPRIPSQALHQAGFSQLRPSLALNWSMVPDSGAQTERTQIASISAGLTMFWQNAVMQLSVARPLSGSDLESPQGGQLDASLSLQW